MMEPGGVGRFAFSLAGIGPGVAHSAASLRIVAQFSTVITLHSLNVHFSSAAENVLVKYELSCMLGNDGYGLNTCTG